MECKYHWGYFIWGYIHTICIIDNYYKEHVIKQLSNNIIILLKSIKLPCDTCQIEFNNELNNLSDNKLLNNWNYMSLFNWSVDFHNKINIKLNKNIINYSDAKKIWYR